MDFTYTHNQFINITNDNLVHAGVYLPDICELQRANPHRSMIELLTSSPETSLDGGSPAAAPSPAPL